MENRPSVRERETSCLLLIGVPGTHRENDIRSKKGSKNTTLWKEGRALCSAVGKCEPSTDKASTLIDWEGTATEFVRQGGGLFFSSSWFYLADKGIRFFLEKLIRYELHDGRKSVMQEPRQPKNLPRPFEFGNIVDFERGGRHGRLPPLPASGLS